MALTFIFLLAIVSSSFAAVAIGPARVNPEYPDQCWMPSQNKAFEIGAQWQEPNCVRASCFMYRASLFVEYATCGAIGGGGPGCVTQQDLSLPYPSCCPEIICPDPTPLSHYNNLIHADYFDHHTIS